jgi:hypothetical protein
MTADGLTSFTSKQKLVAQKEVLMVNDCLLSVTGDKVKYREVALKCCIAAITTADGLTTFLSKQKLVAQKEVLMVNDCLLSVTGDKVKYGEVALKCCLAAIMTADGLTTFPSKQKLLAPKEVIMISNCLLSGSGRVDDHQTQETPHRSRRNKCISSPIVLLLIWFPLKF